MGALALIGNTAKAIQTAKTVKGAIARPNKKGAIIKQKRPSMAQFTQGIQQSKGNVISKQPSMLPSLGFTPQATLSASPRTIKEKLGAILAFIRERKALKKNTRKKVRKSNEKSKRDEKESLKENPALSFIKGVGSRIASPVRSLWDNILKGVGTLLAAQIMIWAINRPEGLIGLVKTIEGIVETISSIVIWTVDIVGGIVKYGYDISDMSKEWVYGLIGEEAAAKLREIEPAIMGVLNVLLGIGMGLATLRMLRPKAGKLPKPKGANARSWKNKKGRWRFPWQKPRVTGLEGSKGKYGKYPTKAGSNFQLEQARKAATKAGAKPKGKGIIENLSRFMKSIKIPVPKWLTTWKGNALINAVLAGFEFKGRKDQGQTTAQAVTGTAASTTGGFAGFWAGAKAGAYIGGSIGAWFGGVGAAPGAFIGGIIGGISGSMLGSSIAGATSDAIMGVDSNPSMDNIPPEPITAAEVRPSNWWDKFLGGDKKSTRPSTGLTGTTRISGEIGKLLDTIAFAEGTANQPNNAYNTHFGFSQTADLSKHPNKVITSGGRSSAAFGRYQFMPGTWASVGGGAMTPARQDWGATRLILMRLGLPQTKAGAAKLEKMLKENGLTPQIIDALAPEWASFPNLFGPDQKGRVGTNTSFYGQGGKTKQQLESYFKGRPSSSTSALPTLNQSIDDQSGNSSFVPVVLPSSNVASAAGKVVVAPLGGVNNNYQHILHMQFYRA